MKPLIYAALMMVAAIIAAFAYQQFLNTPKPLPVSVMQAPYLPLSPFDYAIKLPVHLRELKQYSTQPKDNPLTNHGATLGRVLFYDRGLSRNTLVACSSCHTQIAGFDGPNRFSIGLSGKITERHSTGLAFAGFNANGRYFRDEHAVTLEDQVLEPIHDQIEMGLAKGDLVTRVSMRPWYAQLFTNAFGDAKITQTRISRALAQFVRSMVSFDAPYDRARSKVKDRTKPFPAFSKLQNGGKFLFMTPKSAGGYGCASCHETDAFIMLGRHNNGLDRERNTKPENASLRGASLRNIAVRAPHMHDGRFPTLGAAIDHYSTDIQPHPLLGAQLKDGNGNPLRLNINLPEKAALKAFLETLTDEKFLFDPKYSNPFINRGE